MTLSKWQICFLGLAIILAIFFIPRICWLKKSIRTKAVVYYVDKTRYYKTPQDFPVFQYHTEEYKVTVPGAYNLPYKEGDSVTLLYNPSNHFDIKVDNFAGHWIDRIIWLVPALFIWVLLFFPKDFEFSISFRDGKCKVNFG